MLVPKGEPGLAIPLANSRELSSTVVGLPVRVSLESADGGFAAKSIVLEAVAAWADATRTTQAYPGVERMAGDLRQASERAFRSGAMGPGEALSELIASSRELEREIASALTDLPADQGQERAALRERLRDTRTTTKALYLRSDMYRPEAYKRIFDNSRGSTAIAVRGVSPPYCSGFLVAKDAILTARHCLLIDKRFSEEYDASDLRSSTTSSTWRAPRSRRTPIRSRRSRSRVFPSSMGTRTSTSPCFGLTRTLTEKWREKSGPSSAFRRPP